jgi:hypothetical protein
MSRSVEKWVLVVMLLAAALLLVAELVDHDWVGAGIWTIAIAVVAGLLVRRQRSGSSAGGTD